MLHQSSAGAFRKICWRAGGSVPEDRTAHLKPRRRAMKRHLKRFNMISHLIQAPSHPISFRPGARFCSYMCLWVSVCLGEALKSSSSPPCGSELIKKVNTSASMYMKPTLNIYETRSKAGHRGMTHESRMGLRFKISAFANHPLLPFSFTPPHPRLSAFIPSVLLE